MSNYNKVGPVLIGDGLNVALPSATTLATIQKGDLFVVNEAGGIVVNVAAASAISRNSGVRIVQGTGPGKFDKTPLIRGIYTSKYNGNVYAAPAEQLTYVGFNAVSGLGTIAVLDNTSYELRSLYLDDRRIHGEKQTLDVFNYTTPATGSSLSNLAFGILSNTEQRFYNLPGGTANIKYEVVSNGTYTVETPTLTVVNQSNIVTASGATTVVAGDTIRIGGAGASFAIYTVKSVAGTAITLNNLYAGASGAAIPFGKMTVQTLFGFKLTGLPVAPNSVDTYTKVQFTSSFGITNDDSNYVTVADITKTFNGQGYWEQVKDAEYFAQGYKGVMNRTLFPVPTYPAYFVAGANYDTVVIEYTDVVNGNFQDTATVPLQTTIYIPQVTVPAATGEQAGYTTVTDFVAILNGYFATVVGFSPINTF